MVGDTVLDGGRYWVEGCVPWDLWSDMRGRRGRASRGLGVRLDQGVWRWVWDGGLGVWYSEKRLFPEILSTTLTEGRLFNFTKSEVFILDSRTLRSTE